MMGKRIPHVLDGHKWAYQDGPATAIGEEEAKRYDAALELMEKNDLASQDVFHIASHRGHSFAE